LNVFINRHDWRTGAGECPSMIRVAVHVFTTRIDRNAIVHSATIACSFDRMCRI
jgi:hypothetical protein